MVKPIPRVLLRMTLRPALIWRCLPWRRACSPCVSAGPGSQEVITVAPEAVVHSHIVSPERLPPNLRKFTSVIGDVATTGNSGSGVFDQRLKCLLGIVSQKFSQSMTRTDSGKVETHDIAKYFVPAPIIVAFMPAEIALFDCSIVAVIVIRTFRDFVHDNADHFGTLQMLLAFLDFCHRCSAHPRNEEHGVHARQEGNDIIADQ